MNLPDRRAAVATGSRSSGRLSGMASSSRPATPRLLTGRRDGGSDTPPRRLASLVRIEHTVFALPFAYVGAFLAVDAWPGFADMLWVTLAMVGLGRSRCP